MDIYEKHFLYEGSSGHVNEFMPPFSSWNYRPNRAVLFRDNLEHGRTSGSNSHSNFSSISAGSEHLFATALSDFDTKKKSKSGLA